MTSLCPGPLFTTPGLNQYSTPSSRTSTPSDIDRRFTRVPFNGIPWPKQSPVSRVYDVRNSSTKMILLNNKYTKKGCRLRGQTMNDGDVRAPDPSRHSGESPYVNRKSHVDCLTSSTPVFQPEVKTSLKWANKTQRPPLKFDDGSSVNYKRHTACMTSDDLRLMNWQRPRRSYTSSIIRESQKCKNPLLDDLNPGERLYLYSIAKVYSVDSMRRLKQNQYCQLLQKEGQRGGYSDAEYRRYMKYLSSQRKTQQGTSDTYQRRRIRSAPTNRDTQTDKTESSPSAVTPSEHAQSRPASSKSKSRSTSRPMSRASLASNKSHKKTRETPTATKSKSGTKPSKQANDGVTPTSKKPSGTKPSKASSDETKKDKSTPEKSKTNSSDRDNSKMAETENTDQKVTVVQIQEPQDEEPDEEEAQVRGEEDKVKDSEDTEDRMAPQNRGNSHKEGVDRPKSRLGERPRAKDNSDDDYSSDSDSDSSSSSSDESGADTSKSLSKSEPTESQTRSEPSKTSSSSQKAGSGAASPDSPTKPEVMTGSPPRLETTKKEGSPPKDGGHDASYSEDFSEASKSVSQSHASKSDDNKRKSDSSTNETSEKTSEKSQIKPAPLSESEGQSSSDTSSSVKPAQQTKIPSDTSTATSEDTSTSTSVPKVKVSQDDSKVKDQSYSDDFTESTSQSQSGDKVKGEKSPEVKEEKSEVRFKDEVGVQNSSKDTTGQDKDTGEKSPREDKPYQRERRDSIDMDREGRVKDWDKIEY